MQIRKDIVEYIDNVQGIKCSSTWSDMNNLNKHTLIFKEVLKEYGLRKVML